MTDVDDWKYTYYNGWWIRAHPDRVPQVSRDKNTWEDLTHIGDSIDGFKYTRTYGRIQRAGEESEP